MLSGGEELRIGDVEIAVMAHAPETPGGGADAPTWSVVGRLVDHRTRGARRATWVALGAAGLALAAVALVLVVGGGDDDRSVPQVVRQLAPSTVLVEALRGDRRTATGSGWVLDAGDGLVVTAAHVVNEGVALPRRDRRPGRGRPSSSAARPARTSRCCGCRAASRGCAPPALGKGADLEQGETVVALGYPAGARRDRRGDLDARRRLLREHDLPRPVARRPALPRGRADRHGAQPRLLRRAAGRPRRQDRRRQRRRAHDGLGRPAAAGPELRDRDRPRAGGARASCGAGARSAGPARRSAIRPRRSCSSAGSRPGSTSPARCRAPRPRAPAWAAAARCSPPSTAARSARRCPPTARPSRAGRAGRSSSSRSRGRAAASRARSWWRWRERGRGGGGPRRRSLAPHGRRPRRWSSSAAGRCSRGRSPRRCDAGLEAVVVAKPGSPLPPLDVPVWPEPEQPGASARGRHRRARARRPARRRRARLRHAVRPGGADRAAGGARRRRGGAAGRGLPRPLRAGGAAGPARRPRARGAAARGAGRAASRWRSPRPTRSALLGVNDPEALARAAALLR